MITGIIQFYKFVLIMAFSLTMIGGLKNAALVMMNQAAHAQRGMISYSKYTKMLISDSAPKTGSRK